jgi:hypothetical protein
MAEAIETTAPTIAAIAAISVQSATETARSRFSILSSRLVLSKHWPAVLKCGLGSLGGYVIVTAPSRRLGEGIDAPK